MKKLSVAVCFFASLVAHSQNENSEGAATSAASALRVKSTSLPRKRLLWVSPNGDDSTAVRGSRSKPFKTVFDIHDSSNRIYYGAATVAQPGDWIVFERGIYYVPAIPLNIPGNGTGRGLNLFVPEGTTIIRTDFSNTNSEPLPARLAACGPLIIPGNRSRVVIDGTVIATNNPAFDAVFGWADFLRTYDVRSKKYYGFTNWAASDVILEGHGTLVGWSDVVYVSSTVSGTGGSITCKNVHLRSLWDCLFFSGNNVVRTFRVDALADVKMANYASHGIVVVNGGNWTDQSSVFAATGAHFAGDNNAAAYLVNSTNRFLGTTLAAYGVTNITPFISVGSKSVGWYSSYFNEMNETRLVILGRPDGPPRSH